MTIYNPYFYTLNPDILAYENAWLNYRKTGKRNPAVTRDPIWDSWERCTSDGKDPLSTQAIPTVSEADILDRISRHQGILSIITPFINTMFDAIEDPGFMVCFSDTDATILQSACDDALLERTKEINLIPGAMISENYAGTNSIDLAIRLKKPISVTGAEHFREIFHSLSSASAPIIDYTGNLIGVLSAWGRHEQSTAHILGMVIATAKAIENEIQIQKINDQLIENNNQLKAILQSVPDSVVYIKNNVVMWSNDEMLKLSGKKNINNVNVENAIISMPEIGKIVNDSRPDFDNMKVTVFSNQKSFNCMVNKRTVLGVHGEAVGHVLIFILVEKIEKLSKALNKHTAPYTFETIIGNSKAITDAIAIARRASEHDSRIVIEGESGTGKEIFAQAIHNASSRRNHPFVAIDCGAIPRELFESTLFGYEKGAFTGANPAGSVGAFETAQKGTLFLDEIGNMPIEMQSKLLRVLQENMVTRIGGNNPIHVDVRVIAATKENLQELVKNGDFREDLFYRLNVVYIQTPPLRERIEDIPLLVENYLKVSSIRNRKIKIEKEALHVLQSHDWPGNIRQLFNTIERAEIMITGSTITVDDLPPEIVNTANPVLKRSSYGDMEDEDLFEVKKTLMEMERLYILRCLKANKNNVAKTARELNVSRPTIYKALNGQGGNDYDV